MLNTETPRKILPEFAFGQSLLSVIGGATAILLALFGLVNIEAILMTSFATIAIGITFLLEGIATAAEFPKIIAQIASDTMHRTEVGGGMSAELLAGCVGIALGFIAALGVKSLTLTSVAIIFFGCSLLVSSSILTRINTLKISSVFVSVATGMQILIGLTATILGILSLVGIQQQTLILVSLLAIGIAALVSGIAITSKTLKMMR